MGKVTEAEVIEALVKNDLGKVKEYLSDNDINKMAESPYYGYYGTLLHYACFLGNLDAVEFLLSRGADPNLASKYISHDSSVTKHELGNARPIHWLMLQISALDVVEKILDVLFANGANINATNQFDRTALDSFIVSEYCKSKTDLLQRLALLVKCEADVNSRDCNGKTTLYHALDRDHRHSTGEPFEYEICDFLLSNGAFAGTQVHIKDKIFNAATYALDLYKHKCYDLLKTRLEPDIPLGQKVDQLEVAIKQLNTAIQQLQDRVVALEQSIPQNAASETASKPNQGFWCPQ